jgi:hypothetical protein
LVKNRGAGSWYTIYHHLDVGGAITILKNMSQWEGLSHILWKKKWLKPTTRQVLNLTGPDGTLGPWDLASGSEPQALFTLSLF